MVRKLLIVTTVVLGISLVTLFLPARQMDIEGIGQLSFETTITLSVGSEAAYAAPDDTGWQSPTANEANSWRRPDLMYTSNDRRGWTNIRGEDAVTVNLYNFNLSGISGTIDGIEVDIEASYRPIQALPMVHRVRARLMWNGRTLETSFKETPEVTTTDVYYTLGGPTDTWGRTWTADDFTNANFAVRVTSNMTGGQVGRSDQLWVDHVRVRVYYTISIPPSGWLCGWSNRVMLTIDYNDITAPLTDFPVLVYLSTSSGRGSDDVSFIFDELQSDANRKKIAVTTDDGITQCYVEIEKWDDASEQAWLWVKVPNIGAADYTILYLYYDGSYPDNTAYVGDSGSRPEVWSNGFAAVWHLDETTGGTDAIKDSTSNANHGTDNGSPTLGATGWIDNAIGFDGFDDYIQTLSDESQTEDNITWEVWFKADSTTGSHHILWEGPATENGWGEPGDSTTHEMHLTIGRMNAPNFFVFFYGYEYTTDDWVPAVEIRTGFSDTTNWHYATAVLTGAGSSPSGTLYLDGSSVGTDTGTETDRSNWDTNLRIGRCGVAERYLDGIGDEVRISNTARSAAWIGASYESGRDDLIDFGSEETITEDIVNTPSSKDFGGVTENDFYWSNGSDPSFPLDDGECYFTLTNNSTCPVNISIRATNFSGGVGWTLADSPGADIVTLKVGKSGDNLESDMVILTTIDQGFIPSLGASQSRMWELKLETGTFTDDIQKTSTITLIATFA